MILILTYFKIVGHLYSYAKNTIKISRFFELLHINQFGLIIVFLLDDNRFAYNTAKSIFVVIDCLHGFNSNSKECHLYSCKIEFEIFWCTLHVLVYKIQLMIIFEWKRNSDADYTGNLVDRKITSWTWFLRHLVTASFFKENICIFFITNNFQLAEIYFLI